MNYLPINLKCLCVCIESLCGDTLLNLTKNMPYSIRYLGGKIGIIHENILNSYLKQIQKCEWDYYSISHKFYNNYMTYCL